MTYPHCYVGYSVFVAALIHAYNSVNTNPIVANEAKEHLRISKDIILDPITKNAPTGNLMSAFLRSIPSLLEDAPLQQTDSRQHDTRPLAPMSVQHMLSEEEQQQQVRPNENTLEEQLSWLFNMPDNIFWQGLFPNVNTVFPEGATGGSRGFESEGNKILFYINYVLIRRVCNT
jgi:hypothetical protein